MKSPIISLFKEQLENESKALADEHALEKRGDRLIWWYFKKLVGLDATSIAEIVCDGSADLGIDAIRIDEDNIVHFYSFKNPEKIEASFPAGEVDKTLSGLNLILARQHHNIANEELRGRIEEIYQTVPTGYRLHLVTSGMSLPEEARVKLTAFVEGLGGPSNDFFVWDFEGIHQLQDAFYRKNLPTVEDPIEFEIQFAPYQVRSANHDSYIFHAPGTALASIYKKHGEQLLQQNIRVYQGDNATNSLIRETATGASSANFLHYNNGVTFLCETAQWDGFTRKLTLRRAQVVNGGQTIRVLYGANEEGGLKSDVSVPVRVITSQGDKEFASNVAVNLNNQNRIEPSFLRSNEPRVVQLANALASMGWYLERREEEVDSLTGAERTLIENQIGGSLENRVIRLKEGAQAYVATYLRLPELAKKNPRKIFLSSNDGGYFERVFGPDLTAEKFLQANKLAKLIDDYVRQFMTRKRRKERVPDWRADYKSLLGDDLVQAHGSIIDQVVPQCAVFLTALIFDIYVVEGKRPINDLIEELNGRFDLPNNMLLCLINFANHDASALKSWPTLLKSQAFFDRAAAHIKRLEAEKSKAASG